MPGSCSIYPPNCHIKLSLHFKGRGGGGAFLRDFAGADEGPNSRCLPLVYPNLGLTESHCKRIHKLFIGDMTSYASRATLSFHCWMQTLSDSNLHFRVLDKQADLKASIKSSRSYNQSCICFVPQQCWPNCAIPHVSAPVHCSFVIFCPHDVCYISKPNSHPRWYMPVLPPLQSS